MINLTTSPVVEDRYIAHMAGLNAGQNTIGFTDRFKATYAQKHPISNTISAGIVGPIKGMTVATLGLLASPFLNSTSRASITGSAWDVCSSCGINMKSTIDVLHKASEIFNPRKVVPELAQKFDAYIHGFAAAGKCAVDEEILMNCRAFNYAGSIVDTLVNNYVVVGAATVGLVALYTYSKMNAYAEAECKAEEAMKQNLTERFSKIATRLSNYTPNQAAQECANKILQRRFEINEEVSQLQLPSLTWEGIEEITQPVFNAAVMLRRS